MAFVLNGLHDIACNPNKINEASDKPQKNKLG